MENKQNKRKLDENAVKSDKNEDKIQENNEFDSNQVENSHRYGSEKYYSK